MSPTPSQDLVYMIWPADEAGKPATTARAWEQDRNWLVLDVTEGLTATHVVEGPVTREIARYRAQEIREVAQSRTQEKDPSCRTATQPTRRPRTPSRIPS